MPFPFELEEKGGIEYLHKICEFGVGNWIEVSGGVDLGVVCNLEANISPSPRSSSSTLSSALAGVSAGSGGGSTETVTVATVSGDQSEKWPPLGRSPHQQTTSKKNNLDIGAVEKCGLGDGGLEYWDNDLLETGPASPGQDQSILRLIMGDVEDPSLGLNKLLHSSVPTQEFHFNGGGGGGGLVGMLDQGFGFDPNPPLSKPGDIALTHPLTTPMLQDLRQSLNHQTNPQMFDSPDDKVHVLSNPQLLISQLQAQNPNNPSFFLPFLHTQLDQLPPPSKRHNPGVPMCNAYVQPHHRPKLMGDEMASQEELIMDQLYKAAELVQTGNPILAQEILARLNHQLSPIGKPFLRVAFYFKEALQLLINNPLNNSTSTSPYNTLLKIGAYKSFSEISPIVQFANFTCNQGLLESVEGFERIHIVDFDIGYGGQWASLMQELALIKRGAPCLKITAFASSAIHDQLELGLTRESLNHFAQEININLEFETISLDYLSSSWSMPFDMAEDEAVVVNLPISSLCNLPVPPTMVLEFIKQLSPRIVVTVDRECDRMDLPFAKHTLQAFQSYLVLLESVDDAANISLDTLQKIEAFLIRPGIEKLVLGHHVSPEKLQHWKNMFLSAGFTPVSFSNFTECQAEWLLKRTIARGFHVEKRQASLVLCWQRKELIAASAWRC